MREPVAGEKLDQYELGELLARSGMASIFKAIDADNGAAVALKIPHPQLESDVVFFERFKREEDGSITRTSSR
jgi:serine/threonine-protein kinase